MQVLSDKFSYDNLLTMSCHVLALGALITQGGITNYHIEFQPR